MRTTLRYLILAQILILTGCEKSIDEDLLTFERNEETKLIMAYVTETKDLFSGRVYSKSMGGEESNIRHYKNGLLTGTNTIDDITGTFRGGKPIGLHTRKIKFSSAGSPYDRSRRPHTVYKDNEEVVIEWIFSDEGYIMKGPHGLSSNYISGYVTYYSREEKQQYVNIPIRERNQWGGEIRINHTLEKAKSWMDRDGYYEEYYINTEVKLQRGTCDWNCTDAKGYLNGKFILDPKITKENDPYNRRSCLTIRYLTDEHRPETTEEIVQGACEITKI